MTRKQTSRPRCRHCGRALSRYTIWVEARKPIHVGDSVRHPAHDKQMVPVLEITATGTATAGGRHPCYRVWYGAYGVDGENLFCTKLCGYKLARQQQLEKTQ